MALPLGALPTPRSLAVNGQLARRVVPLRRRLPGRRRAVAFAVLDRSSTPGAIPRIRTNPYWNGARDFTGGMWLDILERNPSLRYVSDGDPAKITFPKSKADELAPEFKSLADPY